MAEATGYASPVYAGSQAHVGRARELPLSGGWLLEREVPDRRDLDATGPYPLLACRDWSALAEDLAACEDLVSVVAVPDPHGAHDEGSLAAAFPDLLVDYKEHFVCALGADPVGIRHHRYYARRALREVEVEEAGDPSAHLDEWVELYGHLVDRHELTGVHAFGRDSFAAQLAVPGAVLLRVLEAGTAIAAQLWYLSDGVAYSHLTAVSPRGYELRATYALYAQAAVLLADRAELLHLGGGAGNQEDGGDGLTRFKAGWATGSVTARLAGRICDPERYAELTAAENSMRHGHFPTYRSE